MICPEVATLGTGTEAGNTRTPGVLLAEILLSVRAGAEGSISTVGAIEGCELLEPTTTYGRLTTLVFFFRFFAVFFVDAAARSAACLLLLESWGPSLCPETATVIKSVMAASTHEARMNLSIYSSP
jgi:hypothetical protein